MTVPFTRTTPDKFFWFNKPEYKIDNGKLTITTADKTDFWQRTHYGFSRDNGHAMLSSISGNFTITVKSRFQYRNRYDQCGILLRIDGLNWIKVSAEHEEGGINRLGSVITNLGYSDWATTDIDSRITEMWYRVKCRDNDFIIESSPDGLNWMQMRIAHLHSRQRPLNAGIYACSPEDGGFEAEFSDFSIESDK
jgi:regulation of enolase protein 1 (concanavalin A-like superfamily)